MFAVGIGLVGVNFLAGFEGGFGFLITILISLLIILIITL